MTIYAKPILILCLLLLVDTSIAAGADVGVPLVAAAAHSDAPTELQQYGALQGDWGCESSTMQADGSWQKSPGIATWSWYYVLDGYAVQDVWQPATTATPMGTNLRTYDPEKKQWNMVWATQTQASFDHYTATYSDGMIVMRGENPPRAKGVPPHAAKITFYNLTDRHFDWKYEAAAPGADVGWSEFTRMSCGRLN